MVNFSGNTLENETDHNPLDPQKSFIERGVIEIHRDTLLLPWLGRDTNQTLIALHWGASYRGWTLGVTFDGMGVREFQATIPHAIDSRPIYRFPDVDCIIATPRKLQPPGEGGGRGRGSCQSLWSRPKFPPHEVVKAPYPKNLTHNFPAEARRSPEQSRCWGDCTQSRAFLTDAASFLLREGTLAGVG